MTYAVDKMLHKDGPPRHKKNYIIVGDERLAGIGMTMDQMLGLSLDMRRRQQLRTMPIACACAGDYLR